MTEIGGVFTTEVSVGGQSFTTIFAPTGETIKVKLVLPLAGTGIYVKPASGSDSNSAEGFTADGGPTVGGIPTSNGKSLEAIYMSDSQGLYVGNNETFAIAVSIQGVRVA